MLLRLLWRLQALARIIDRHTATMNGPALINHLKPKLNPTLFTTNSVALAMRSFS